MKKTLFMYRKLLDIWRTVISFEIKENVFFAFDNDKLKYIIDIVKYILYTTKLNTIRK